MKTKYNSIKTAYAVLNSFVKIDDVIQKLDC